MPMTRRKFLTKLGAAGLVGSTLATARGGRAADEQGAGPRCLDYGQSFIANTAPANAVRFWIESRTTLFDDQAGTRAVFYQCASCKSENTFGAKDLFLADNYDFLPILGEGMWLIFRRHARMTPRYRSTYQVEDVWGAPRLLLREARPLTVLDTWEKVRDATAVGLPLVTQTEIADPRTGLRAVIECPTKTMNINLQKK